MLAREQDQELQPQQQRRRPATRAYAAEEALGNKATVKLQQTYTAVQACKKRQAEEDEKLQERTDLSKRAKVDNEDGDYVVVQGDFIGDYSVQHALGSGSFGTVVRALHRPTNELRALKVIKARPNFTNQAQTEIAILLRFNAHPGNFHCVHFIEHFDWRGHVCLVFELLYCNLYQLIHHNDHRGLKPSLIANFGYQLLKALQTLREHGIIHCDMKPEKYSFRSFCLR